MEKGWCAHGDCAPARATELRDGLVVVRGFSLCLAIGHVTRWETLAAVALGLGDLASEAPDASAQRAQLALQRCALSSA